MSGYPDEIEMLEGSAKPRLVKPFGSNALLGAVAAVLAIDI